MIPRAKVKYWEHTWFTVLLAILIVVDLVQVADLDVPLIEGICMLVAWHRSKFCC